jgi:hypothetical protein
MIEYARLITKSSEGVPTIPPSASHDNGDWSSNDIYEHELYLDSVTGYFYTRKGDEIVRITTTSLDFVPYRGATADLDLGAFDLYTNKVWLYDEPNADYGSIHLTDGVFHVEDVSGHSMITFEDGFFTFANGPTTRALLNVTGLTANRDYVLPNVSGTLALTSDIPSLAGYVPTSRMLSINGTAYDLSADRSWTISTGITVGTTPITSGTDGRILFQNGGVVSQSANFYWDNTASGLQVQSENGASGQRGLSIAQFNTGPQSALISFQKSRGTIAAPLDVVTGDLIGFFHFSARMSGSYTSDRAAFGANAASASGIGVFIIGGSSNGNYNPGIYVHPSNNVTIGSSQSVLTGITDTGFRFDVNGTSRFQSNLQANGNVIFGTSNGFYWDSTTQRAGFGTNAPQATVHIQTGSSEKLRLETNGSIGNFVTFYNSGARKGYLGRASSNDDLVYFNDSATGNMIFGTNGAARITIFNDGNIGVNTTTNAGYKADINGTMRVSGNLTLTNGSLILSSYYTVGDGTYSLRRDYLSSYDPFRIYTIVNQSPLYLGSGVVNTCVVLNGVNDTQRGFGIADDGTPSLLNSAVLQLNSTKRGFLPPRMTTAQKNAIASPVPGLQVYDTTLNLMSYYNGTIWI